MDDKKVKEIFSRHLQDKNVNEAVAETHREMGESVLTDIYESQVVDKAVWELLLKIIRSMARVNLFSPYFKEAPETDTVLFGPEFFDDIFFFFQTWRDVAAYVAANFDQLMSETIRAQYNAGHVQVILTGIDQQMAMQAESVLANNTIPIDRKEFEKMTLGLTLGLRYLMGKENHNKFREEFNKHLLSLKIYYALAVSSPKPGSRLD